MVGTFAWALMNGLIIGAVWIGIVLWNRQKRLDASRRASRTTSRAGRSSSRRCTSASRSSSSAWISRSGFSTGAPASTARRPLTQLLATLPP